MILPTAPSLQMNQPRSLKAAPWKRPFSRMIAARRPDQRAAVQRAAVQRVAALKDVGRRIVGRVVARRRDAAPMPAAMTIADHAAGRQMDRRCAGRTAMITAAMMTTMTAAVRRAARSLADLASVRAVPGACPALAAHHSGGCRPLADFPAADRLAAVLAAMSIAASPAWSAA
jgi:hypothetical protein